MESQEITFEQLPQAVNQLCRDMAFLKKHLLEKNDQQKSSESDRWFDLSELCEYLPDKPAKGYLHALYLTTALAGRGFGRRMVALVEEHARELGFKRIGLHSSRTARGFYLRLGFGAEGEEVLYRMQGIGLPCQPMGKDLPEVAPASPPS